MNRRDFIRNLGYLAGGTTIALSIPGCDLFSAKEVRFGISADIHKDVIHDADERLKAYLKEMKSRNPDFLMDLGDFAHPIEANKGFLNIWNSTGINKHQVLGNHEMDKGTKQDFMNYVGMEKPYYSFDQEDFHFIGLDPNNLLIDGEYIPYANSNFYKPAEQRGYIDPEQLEWLRNDLESTDKPCIVFSHQSLEHPGGCKNNEKVRATLEQANRESGFQKVIAAFSGHHHHDYARQINGIHYVQINSMSYHWVGDKYKYPERFSGKINREHPYVQYTIPYRDPLFAFVKIKDGVIRIDGVKSTFIEPGPEALDIPEDIREHPIVARISDRTLNVQLL